MPAPATAPSRAPEPAPPRPPLSRSKRIAFTAGAVILVPLLLFGLAEGALRAVGYGEDLPLFEPYERNPDYLVQSRTVAQRYFYGNANAPTGLYDFFRAERDTASLRLFVMGESSAAGFPFYYGAAFSRQLHQRLQQTFPDRTVEVVNTAMAAISSYALRDFVPEILAQRPDAILIYAGHNEFYGALGVGSSESLGRVPAFVNLYLTLQKLRVVQALRAGIGRLVATAAGANGGADRATLMERMVGEQRIPIGSELERAGERQFRENLGAVLAAFERAGVPVFIGTLASNERDQPPFISSPARNTPGGEAAFSARVRAAEALAATDPAAARTALEALVRADSVDALSRYALARVLERQGDAARARAMFLAAKDRDQLRFRAPERFNALIRTLARAHGATVVETQAALAAASPGGIIGHEMMTEHLHPTPKGYFVISDAFYRALQAARVGGDYRTPVATADADAERLLTPVDSLVGTYRLLQLRAAWPFQPVGVRLPYLDTLRARAPLDSIALALFRGETTWPDANEAQRRHFVAVDDLRGALRTALVAIQEYPFSAGTYAAAGTILMEQKRYDEALAYFEEGTRREPSALAETLLGSLLLARSRTAEAIPHLERALSLDAKNPQALFNLAGAYALEGRFADAAPLLRRLLAADPARADARSLLAQIERAQAGRTGS